MDFVQDEYSTTFILGARGVGKTISAFVESIKHCWDNDQKFIYLRRYETEVDTLGLNLPLISKLTGLEVNYEVATDKNTGRRSKMITASKGKTKKNVGYVMALSTASKYKSNDYTGTYIIIYDEFIDIRNKEIKNEPVLFLNFAMTVFRDFNDYKALFLANATNLFNCYFISFNIFPNARVNRYRDKGIKVVMYETSPTLNGRNRSQLARLYMYSTQDLSALNNKFYIESGFLSKLTKHSKPVKILHLKNVDYCLWTERGKKIISTKIDPSLKKKESMDELIDGYVYDPILVVYIFGYVANGNLYFDNEKTRGIWMKYFKERGCI